MTIHNTTPIIHVATIGMDERMRNLIRQFFQKCCNNHYLLSEAEHAHISIADLDGNNGISQWNDYRKAFPKQPAIVISLQEQNISDVIFVKKPINPQALADAFTQARELLDKKQTNKSPVINNGQCSAPSLSPAKTSHTNNETRAPGRHKQEGMPHSTHGAARLMDERNVTAFIGTAPDIDLGDIAQLSKIQYHPEHYLQQQIEQAISRADKKSCGVRLQTTFGSIDIAPNSHDVFMDIPESNLRTLSIVPLVKGTITLSDHDPSEFKQHHSNSTNRDALLWKCALWASRGRIPNGTPADIPVFLRHWPNMTRMMLFPYAVQIAALWHKQPYSLGDTSKLLNIPQRFVFAFYSATNALGLADITKRQSDTLFNPPPAKTHPLHNLFGRIISHLYAH